MEKEGNGIILFDGVCNLCHFFVQFVLKRDSSAQFKFAALQSEIGQRLLTQYQIGKEIDSVVLIYQNKAFTASNAGIEILRKLSIWWQWTVVLYVIPKRWRDIIYHWVAANRYRWFGKKDVCWVPTPALRERFLSWE